MSDFWTVAVEQAVMCVFSWAMCASAVCVHISVKQNNKNDLTEET